MFSTIYKNIFLTIAAIIMLGSLGIVAVLGLPFGIDFTGGSQMEVSYDTAPSQGDMTRVITNLNLGGFSARATGADATSSGYIIRTRALADSERSSLETAVISVGTGGKTDQFTSVGPVIGSELKTKALWAIAIVSLIITIYVAYVFAGVGKPVSSWVYGSITIFVLFHDILVPTAMMSLLGHFIGAEVDVLFVMAILAVLGYSVNDTIVIFDRVRENLKANRTEKRSKKTEPGGIVHEIIEYTLTKPFGNIVGEAVSNSLARSINTSLTVFISLLALYFLGGSLTQNFALVLIVGVIAGTYSSICIASPMLVAYAEYIDKKAIRDATAKATINQKKK